MAVGAEEGTQAAPEQAQAPQDSTTGATQETEAAEHPFFEKGAPEAPDPPSPPLPPERESQPDDDALIAEPGPEGELPPPADPENPELYDWEADPAGFRNMPVPEGVKLAKRFGGETLLEAMQQLEKGYLELHQKLVTRGDQAPEEYAYDAEVYEHWDDGGKEQFEARFGDIGLSQDQYNAIAERYAELGRDISQRDQKAQLAEAWGVKEGSPQWEERIGRIERYVLEQIRAGQMNTEAAYNPQFGSTRTATGILGIEYLMSRQKDGQAWTGGAPRTSGLTLDEAKAYLVDPAGPYQDESHKDHARVKEMVDKAFEDAYPGTADQAPPVVIP